MSLSIDGTMKCCMPLLGQPKWNEPKQDYGSVTSDTPWHKATSFALEQKRYSNFQVCPKTAKVLTVRGRTGCTLAMTPVPGEDSSVIADALEKCLPKEAHSQVRVVFSDDPSGKLYVALKSVLPKLEFLCLDPVHLPMTLEYASSRKRTKASKTLRAIMSKFTASAAQAVCFFPSQPFTGAFPEGLSLLEENKRALIRTAAMPRPAAESLLGSLDVRQPWASRVSFIEALAALAAVYPEELSRIIPGPNRSGHGLLYSACAPARLEWFFNNLRARRSLPTEYLTLLPTGTTSNEALHAELKTWFLQTQKLHRSTLLLKLHILCLAKMLPHVAALSRPTLRQMGSAKLLSHLAAQSPWGLSSDWNTFTDSDSKGKAELPLAQKRKQEQEVTQQFAKKRPAFKRPAAIRTKSKLTAFTRPRESALRIMGKKSKTSAIN